MVAYIVSKLLCMCFTPWHFSHVPFSNQMAAHDRLRQRSRAVTQTNWQTVSGKATTKLQHRLTGWVSVMG